MRLRAFRGGSRLAIHIVAPHENPCMKILVDSGIIAARKEGKWTYYSISETGGENAVNMLRELTTVAEDESFQQSQKIIEASLDKTNVGNERCCT